MISTENKVIAVTGTTALALLVGLSIYTDLSTILIIVIVFVVGVALPQIYLNYGRV
jgi:hypothetical protein